MSKDSKPGIVFCHGLWADGSCFSKLIVPLQAEGYECIAAQYGLNTTAEDVALVKATMGRVSHPVILVGHSYGGSVITGAGTDDRVVGLVRSEEHTSELQSRPHLVCRLLLEKKNSENDPSWHYPRVS